MSNVIVENGVYTPHRGRFVLINAGDKFDRGTTLPIMYLGTYEVTYGLKTPAGKTFERYAFRVVIDSEEEGYFVTYSKQTANFFIENLKVGVEQHLGIALAKRGAFEFYYPTLDGKSYLKDGINDPYFD